MGLLGCVEDVEGALHGGAEEGVFGVGGVVEGAGGCNVEDAGAAGDCGGEGGGVEDVGEEEFEAGGGVRVEGEEVGRVGTWEDGGVDGVAWVVVEEGVDEPGTNEAVGAGDADNLGLGGGLVGHGVLGWSSVCVCCQVWEVVRWVWMGMQVVGCRFMWYVRVGDGFAFPV